MALAIIEDPVTPGSREPDDWVGQLPEVFRRDRPGFDMLLGNPPWGRIRKALPEQQAMARAATRMYRLQGLGTPEYAQLFAELYPAGVRRASGGIGMLLPGGSMTAGIWAPLRAALLRDADVHVTPALNKGNWLFSSLTHQTTAALAIRGPAGGEPGVTLHPVI